MLLVTLYAAAHTKLELFLLLMCKQGAQPSELP